MLYKNRITVWISSIFTNINNQASVIHRHNGSLNLCMCLIFIVSVTACSNSGTSSESDEPDMILDLNTLTANSPHGILQAEPVENAFVGQVNDDLFIGIALAEDGEGGQSQEIIVYLCDGEYGEWLAGELEPGGGAKLENAGLYHSETNTIIEGLSITDSAISGKVILWGEEAHPFTATAATDDAGLFWAWKTNDDSDVVIFAGWVVLSDGRQQGFHGVPIGAILAEIFCSHPAVQCATN
jgi:hypothetical protein